MKQSHTQKIGIHMVAANEIDKPDAATHREIKKQLGSHTHNTRDRKKAATHRTKQKSIRQSHAEHKRNKKAICLSVSQPFRMS